VVDITDAARSFCISFMSFGSPQDSQQWLSLLDNTMLKAFAERNSLFVPARAFDFYLILQKI